ncbi:hypothetical protein GQ42DRAFT_138483, partial [Ramicandelaber brevisporus]
MNNSGGGGGNVGNRGKGGYWTVDATKMDPVILKSVAQGLAQLPQPMPNAQSSVQVLNALIVTALINEGSDDDADPSGASISTGGGLASSPFTGSESMPAAAATVASSMNMTPLKHRTVGPSAPGSQSIPRRISEASMLTSAQPGSPLFAKLQQHQHQSQQARRPTAAAPAAPALINGGPYS